MNEELRVWTDEDYGYYMMYLNGQKKKENETVCSFLKKINEIQTEKMAERHNALDYTRPAKVRKEVKKDLNLFSRYDRAMRLI